MNDRWSRFEKVARSLTAEYPREKHVPHHPFDERNIHPEVTAVARRLFDDGHYSQATFEAYKLLDKIVRRHSKAYLSGVKLMMKVFDRNNPLIKLNSLLSDSEKDEQEGYKFLFSGAVAAIRNPRGHEVDVRDDPDDCLDYLTLASMLLRRLDRIT